MTFRVVRAVLTASLVLLASCTTSVATPEITSLQVRTFALDHIAETTTTFDFAARTIAIDGVVTGTLTADAVADFQAAATTWEIPAWNAEYVDDKVLDGGGTELHFTFVDGTTQTVKMVNVYEPGQQPPHYTEFREAVNGLAGNTVL
ncbi:MAG: hypothetical protein LBR58_11855 [Propionibacteriaceae bacterium]|jgi:hypothetical protein|nr:hypothetical protein [Propionibacteriaceae bacterium]